MITAARFYGGSQTQTLPTPPTILKLNCRFARLWRLRAGAGSMHVKMLDPEVAYNLMRPGLSLWVWNDGANDFDVKESDGTLIKTVAVDECWEIILGSSPETHWTTVPADYFWMVKERVLLS